MPEDTAAFRRHIRILTILAVLLWISGAPAVRAGQAAIAVAANFTAAATEIGTRFEEATGHRAVFSFGSTGQLYAQITQGAPFDVYLAADRVRPEKAVSAGYAVAGSRFTYATGRLVLYSRDAARVQDAATLRSAFNKIAIANPVTAPYGAAAVEVLKALDIYDALAGRIVRGNNIAQAYQFVETGNAELGLVALSQVAHHDAGSRWLVPQRLHSPIAQDAVLLKQGAGNPAARAFLAFLRGPEAGALKQRHGYGS